MNTLKLPENIAGKNIKRKRNELKLTQTEFVCLCRKRGWMISRNILAKIESGLRRIYDTEILLLCDIFLCSPKDLLDCSQQELQRIVRAQSA